MSQLLASHKFPSQVTGAFLEAAAMVWEGKLWPRPRQLVLTNWGIRLPWTWPWKLWSAWDMPKDFSTAPWEKNSSSIHICQDLMISWKLENKTEWIQNIFFWIWWFWVVILWLDVTCCTGWSSNIGQTSILSSIRRFSASANLTFTEDRRCTFRELQRAQCNSRRVEDQCMFVLAEGNQFFVLFISFHYA